LESISDQNLTFIGLRGTKLEIQIEERIFKLERDEAAFLATLKSVNTKYSTSINHFLMSQARGEQFASLDDIMKKKKVLQEKKPVGSP